MLFMHLSGKRLINFAFRIFIPSFFIFSVVIVAVLAQQSSSEQLQDKERISYTQLMREVRKRKSSSDRIEKFINQQKAKLDNLGVSGKKKRRYFELLERAVATQTQAEPAQTQAEPRFKLPARPGRFHFSKDPQVIHKLNNTKIFPKRGQKISGLLKKLVVIEQAKAVEDQFLPTLDDVRQDNGEIKITPEMKDIAADLQHNPVKILNFVLDNIVYEPYYGAKKGSAGCLREKVCNDTDASSLLAALLRAAGIPARYEKSAAVFTVQQLQNLLGVDQTKTVYAAFSNNKVPVFVLSDALDGVSFEQADFSAETHLVLEWTHVEAFYEYDERGGNVSNNLDLSGAANTDEVKDALRGFSKKQWIPIDPIMKPYTRTLKPILADLANFNTENFWYGFFEYQGTESPLGKYMADLAAATGQQISNNLSIKSSPEKDLSILPITLPYFIGTGQTDETEITLEKFSILPDLRRQKVSISLKRDSNDEVVLSRTYFGSEINNGRIDLLYEGLTDTDKTVIAEYGGIPSTPAALVDIAPYLQIEDSRYEGVETATSNSRPSLEIGETLVLQFEYFVNGESVYDDQKFSIAGNNEGIFITLSQIAPDGLLDDTNDENRHSHILLEGNAALAREYMRKIQEDGATIKQSLDYEYNLQFGRAVVTQNRILTEVDGTPTTFDFKGLSLDAAVYIADYSNRGIYNNHRKDFRLLWGEQASYMEGELFETVASLDSISTVKGLQFAHANPAAYTVQTITSANESLIDQLQLSENTKQNMHTDVQAGNTIITPDKAVENQNWRGIFYVSLRSDWTALYAIGEQTGNNGGFTVVTIETDVYCDAQCVNIYYTSDGAQRFLHEDKPYLSVRCTISETTYLEITNNQNVSADAPIYERWRPEYGAPCFRETKTFGTVNRSFILTTNGAKFYAQQIPLGQSQPTGLHSYWVKHDIAKQTVFQNVQNPDETKFKFNIIAGTYSYNTFYDVYYEPVQPTLLIGGESWLEKGRSWVVNGAILSKLKEPSYKKEYLWCPPNDSYCKGIAYKRNWVIDKIGYPIGAQTTAAESYPYGTEGSYQDFIGGQIYYETTWINHAYYVPGYIEKEYNRQQYCQAGYGCGTGGELGFPVSDPQYNQDGDYEILLQDFEDGTRIKDFMNRPVPDRIEVTENVQTISIIRNYTDGAYHDELIEGIMDAFAEFDVYGVSINFTAGLSVPFVINAFKGHIVKKLGKKAVFKVGLRYMPVVGWVFSGVTAALAVNTNWPLYEACGTDPDLTPLIDGKPPAYYCGKLAVNGIAFGLGAATSTGASKLINKFGAATQAARRGKSLFLSRVKDSNKWPETKKLIYDNPKSRTGYFEVHERITPDDSFLLANNPKTTRILLEKPIYQITFDSYVKTGSYADAIIRKYHPKYNTQLFNGVPEKDLYSLNIAFDMQKTINKGINKLGFYNTSEIDNLLQMYKNRNFAQVINDKKGELIFVKKLDGTTVIAAREYDDVLPHPFLSKGEKVMSAGTIEPKLDPNGEIIPNQIILRNKSGHFLFHEDEMWPIKEELESLGYSVQLEAEPIPQ